MFALCLSLCQAVPWRLFDVTLVSSLQTRLCVVPAVCMRVWRDICHTLFRLFLSSLRLCILIRMLFSLSLPLFFFSSFPSTRHRHAVQKVSEAQVSAQADGFTGAIRSLVQWKDKPDHVFSACDDGTIKVGGVGWVSKTQFAHLTVLPLSEILCVCRPSPPPRRLSFRVFYARWYPCSSSSVDASQGGYIALERPSSGTSIGS